MNGDIDHGMLITSRFVRQLGERVPGFRRNLEVMQRSGTPALEYPDGSLELTPECHELWLACWRPVQEMRAGGSMLGVLSSLPWLPGVARSRVYKVLSTKEHEARIDPHMILFAPSRLSPQRPPESTDLAELHLSVQCHRRISRDAMRVLKDAICAWHASVAKAGLHGEGPIGKLSSEIEFQGRRAQFVFDAGQTGQRTINWLILSLLNAAYDVMRLSAFVFNDVGNLATYGFEASEHKVVRVPLAPGQAEPGPVELLAGRAPASRVPRDVLPFPSLKSPRLDQAPESRLPPGLIPFPGLESRQFTIWQTPSLEWESMRLAVYFDDWPTTATAARVTPVGRRVVAGCQCRRFWGPGCAAAGRNSFHEEAPCRVRDEQPGRHRYRHRDPGHHSPAGELFLREHGHRSRGLRARPRCEPCGLSVAPG